MTEFQKTMYAKAKLSETRAVIYDGMAKSAFSQEEQEALLQIADGFRKLAKVQEIMAADDDEEADA